MSNIPGISVPDVFIHAAGGDVQITEEWEDERPAAARVTYRCRWDDRFALYRELKGAMTSGGLALVFPDPPHRYHPSSNLYCVGVSMKPHTDFRKTNLSTHEFFPYIGPTYALVTANYRAPSYAVDQTSSNPANQIDSSQPILFCRQRIRAANAYITFEGAQLQFQNSGDPIETVDGIPNNTIEFAFEFPRLAVNPWGFLSGYLGRVNSVEMWGLPPGHILFNNFDTDLAWSLDGVEASANLTFAGSLDVQWNERLNKEGDPELVKFINSSPARFPFTEANLWEIFFGSNAPTS